jgi:hypothetical protein
VTFPGLSSRCAVLAGGCCVCRTMYSLALASFWPASLFWSAAARALLRLEPSSQHVVRYSALLITGVAKSRSRRTFSSSTSGERSAWPVPCSPGPLLGRRILCCDCMPFLPQCSRCSPSALWSRLLARSTQHAIAARRYSFSLCGPAHAVRIAALATRRMHPHLAALRACASPRAHHHVACCPCPLSQAVGRRGHARALPPIPGQ